MQGGNDMENEMQERVARLMAMKRLEAPPRGHLVGLSRAVRFRIEQENAARQSELAHASGRQRGGAHGWFAMWEGLRERFMEPSAWVPTALAIMVILAWVLGDQGGAGRIGPALQTAGFGNLPPSLVGQGHDLPKASPIVGVHVRMIFLDSDQLPPGFVAFPQLSPGMTGKAR